MLHYDPSASGVGTIEKPYIFVSYSRKDRGLVYPELERLELEGYRFWCDTRDIPVGEFWRDHINKAIRDCNGFLLFMSPDAAASIEVEKEIDYALEFPKFMIVIYLEELELSRKLKDKIGQIQSVEFFSSSKLKYQHDIHTGLFGCVGKLHSRRNPISRVEPPLPTIKLKPSNIPRAFVFSLTILSLLFLFLAVMIFATTYFKAMDLNNLATTRMIDPTGLLSNRSLMFVLSFSCSGISAILAFSAFLVNRIFVRRNDG